MPIIIYRFDYDTAKNNIIVRKYVILQVQNAILADFKK